MIIAVGPRTVTIDRDGDLAVAVGARAITVVGDGDLAVAVGARTEPSPLLVTAVAPELVLMEPSPPRTVEPETSDPLASQRAGLTVTPGWEVMERVRSGVKAPVDWVSRLRSGSSNIGIGGIWPGS